jgi:hypothetical protein
MTFFKKLWHLIVFLIQFAILGIHEDDSDELPWTDPDYEDKE